MKSLKSTAIFLALTLVLLVSGGTVAAVGQGTEFTYQARITQDDSPVNASCDLQFGLFDAVTGGTQVGTTQTKSNVTVSDGLFTVSLDFGSGAFSGDSRWLEVSVRCPSGGGEFRTFSPRRPVSSSPYALYAPTAGSAPWSGLTGVPADLADGIGAGQGYDNPTGRQGAAART